MASWITTKGAEAMRRMTQELARPTAEEILMNTALLWAERSTCERAHVGAVIAIDGRTISTGYNGAPAGLPHCNHHVYHAAEGVGHGDLDPCPLALPTCRDVAAATCPRAVHAEANAIAFAARHGVALLGSTIYTTHAPCVPCAQLIINSGIKEVVYLNDYRITDGRKLLDKVGIQNRQVAI